MVEIRLLPYCGQIYCNHLRSGKCSHTMQATGLFKEMKMYSAILTPGP